MIDINLFDLNNIKDYSASTDEITEISPDDISIIGISVRLPFVKDKEEFWKVLAKGKDCVTDLPEIRKDDITNYLNQIQTGDNIEYLQAAYLDRIDLFDYDYFKLTPREATLMDPHHRIFLESAYEAIEDAGYGGKRLVGSRTGIYAGISNLKQRCYSEIITELEPDYLSIASSGNIPSIMPSRISYLLDLRGPSVVVDTACSSSLVAVHMACQGIKNGDCDIAIAGSTKLHVFPLKSSLKMGIESSDGRTKAFDNNSDGTGIGEGSVVILLKSLSSAIRDGDNIYAVIKGSAINQDGSSIGITAPNAVAQADVMHKAWKNAKINPETISYIEAHGTGTKLGDPIEIDGLQRAFEKYTNKKQFCAIGSVKSNIGHLLDCSGVVSLIKAVLALQHKEIPPSVHFNKPNDKINFENSPIYVNDRLSSWDPGNAARICGVNSFGISGTNCHIVLQEFIRKDIIEYKDIALNVLTLSAKSKESLLELIRGYKRYLSSSVNLHLNYICFTANTGRGHYNYRVVLLLKNITELNEGIEILDGTDLESLKHDRIFYGYSQIQQKVKTGGQAGELTEDEYRDLCEASDKRMADFKISGKTNENSLLQLCKLYIQGADLNWNELYNNEENRIVDLPVYPFSRKRCWVSTKKGNTGKLSMAEKCNGPDYFTYKVKPNGRETGAYSQEERAIANIWGEVLGFDEVNINDNFYEIGGDSIIATKLANRICMDLDTRIDVSEILYNPTIEGLASCLSLKLEERKRDDKCFKLQKSEEMEYYPLSSSQRRIFLLHQLGNLGVAYNLPSAFSLEGAIDVKRLEETFKTIIDRHESLRTSFLLISGEPVQKVHKEVNFRLEYLNGDTNNLESIIKEFIRPFDLGKAPLLRACIVKLTGFRHILLFDIHHVIADGTSLGILIREIVEIYKGSNIPKLKYQYKDYAVWQNKLITSAALKKQEEYWINRFTGENPVLDMQTDYPRSTIQNFEGDKVVFYLDINIVAKLKEMAKERGVTLFMILLSAYYVMLYKCTGQSDIVIGTAIAGRQDIGLENIIGVFINMLALRNYPEGDKRFEDFLLEVRDTTIQAYKNQDYQFEELVSKANVKRDLSRNPLFDTAFVFQNMEIPDFEIDGLKFTQYNLSSKSSQYDFSLWCAEHDDGIRCEIEYCCKLYNRSTVNRWAGYFQNILNKVVKDFGLKLKSINMLMEPETNKILYEFNNTGKEYEKGKTINQLFVEQVKKTPNDMALVFKDKHLTYEELDKRSDFLADRLRKMELGRNNIVGLMVSRSLEMVVAIIAIFKAGGAYLPIDPAYPTERVKYMLDDSKTDILLIDDSFMKIDGFNGQVLNIKDDSIYVGDRGDIYNINGSSDLAYVIYTSGTTGNPKGVMIEHQSINNFIMGITDVIKVSGGTTVLALTTISFDIFVLETILPLTKGACVVVADESEQKDSRMLGKLIDSANINMLQMTPSRLQLLLSGNGSCEFLQKVNTIIIGGEAFPDNLLAALRKVAKARIYNVYGPTEATVWSTIRDVTLLDEIDIGKPLANTQIYILDENDNIQPIAVKGELCIGGDGLARGYLNKTDLTLEKFVPNPYGNGKRIYRTGDLAEWMPDGNIKFIERKDYQVKVRGHRIEPAEIEKVLLAVDEIVDCVVSIKQYDNGEKYLVAYYVSDRELTVTGLRMQLAKNLPEYMIPSLFVRLDKLPLTPNGKIDRKLLPDPDNKRPTLENTYIEPKTKTEEIIADIWRNVIKRPIIGIEDNFFELGGNSLLLVQMHALVDKLYPSSLSVADIFANPTISKIAEYIDNTISEKRLFCLDKLKFPVEYFVEPGEDNEGASFEFELADEMFSKLISLLHIDDIELNDILLSIFLYLLSEILKIQEVTIQTLFERCKLIIPVSINMNIISDFKALFQMVAKECRDTEKSNAFNLSDLDRLTIENDSCFITPLFTDYNSHLHKYLNTFDIILKIVESEDTIGFVCEFNSCRLRKMEVERLMYAYIKLINLVIDDIEKV